jgi:TetR/AcrR family transcriptional regulator, transcriptional repressor for nem operon
MVASMRILDPRTAVHRDSRSNGCPIPALAGDLPRLSRAARARFSAGVQQLSKALAERMRALEVPDAESAASSIVAELVGALSLARAEPDAQRSNAILVNSRRHLKQRLGLEIRGAMK